jgi:hypothetical protein
MITVLAIAPLCLLGIVRASDAKETMNAGTPMHDKSTLETREQSLSYALGMVLGTQLRQQSVEVDLDFYSQGLRDALSGSKTLLKDTEARKIVDSLQRELQRQSLASQTATKASDIEISFKLDSRVTKSMYMGDRWVSPPVFAIVQQGQEATIEARANVVDAGGRSLKVNSEWRAEDPEMVLIQPVSDGQVNIIVRRSGESRLRVVSQGVSKTMGINAKYKEDSIQVEISK